MGALKLELHHSSQRVDDNDIAANLDPEPDWSFDALVSELNALEDKLAATSSTQPLHFHKTTSRLNLSGGKEIEKGRAFVFCAPEYETESEDDDDKALVVASTGKRFNYDELYPSDSDDSDVDPAFEVQPYLMNKVGEVEGALIELTQEHQLRVKDEIRNKISVLETSLLNESQNSISSLLRVEKFKETRQELDKKFDTQYQRQIAEALDSHLTAVQRDRELRSQIEERKIRNDAAYEEAKRKAAMQEEKQQQEKAKAEAEAKLKAEEVKQAALEAERKATMEAKTKAAMEAGKRAEKDAIESSKKVTSGVAQDTESSLLNTETKESGYVYRAAASALNIEHGRLQKLKELCEGNQVMRSSSKQDYAHHESHISRNIKTIRGISNNVRSKARELINLLNDRQCPQSFSAEIFVKKVVSSCASPGSAPFAIAYVIVLVTSEVPYVMDLLLAELHRACLYTVPKHMVYKKSIFQSKEAYFRSIGYREDSEKLESTEDYLKRLESYMKLYGALVQTEIPNIRNLHGLQEGWAWLARFLNSMPANLYTAVSLDTFLQMAGFALFKRYKSQFLKMLNVISDKFLVDLKSHNAPESTKIVANIQAYIEDRKFRQVPEGRNMQSDTLSRVIIHKI